MLKITVSIVPGGFGPERKLGELLISNVAGSALSDYRCELSAADLPEPKVAYVSRYPRWSASVWDLVARAICKALGGHERLPRRPAPLDVPVRTDPASGIPYVRLSDIPEPARSAFARRTRGATRPVIAGEERDCFYAWDWIDFIGLGRRS